MEDKFTPTAEMVEYLVLDKQLKELEAHKEVLRKKIIPELRDHEYSGIALSVRKSVKLNDDAFMEWVNLYFPDCIDKVTRPVIDYEKFEACVARGEIVYDEIPEACYRIIESNVITIEDNKRKNGYKAR